MKTGYLHLVELTDIDAVLMKERYDTKELRKAYYCSKYENKKLQPNEREQHIVLGWGEIGGLRVHIAENPKRNAV